MIANLSAEFYTIYAFVGLLVGIATLIGYIKRPWTEKAKIHRQQQKVLKLFMNGDPGVKGLIETIIPGPERVAEAEYSIKEHTQLLKQQGEIQKQQGILLKDVSSRLSNLTDIIVKLDKKMTSNGGNTNDPGDVQMRMAKSTGMWLTEDELKKIKPKNEQ